MQSEQRLRWAQRRWLDFRSGHSFYLGLALSAVNFVVISHRFVIERVPLLENFFLFRSLTLFALTFALVYSILATAIGYWHRTRQLKVEQTLYYQEFPIAAKVNRVILDAITGKASKEELDEVNKLLRKIESRGL